MPPGVNTEEVLDRQKAETLLTENVGWIERTAAALCRRFGVSGEDAEDVCSWVKEKLVEDDYGAIRKFRGDSHIRTYLVVVVTSLFRDYRASNWGRWRPSAAALRHGPLAVRLETLVYRDGCTLDQAARSLRASGETDSSDAELARLLAELPVRGPLRPYPAGDAPLETLPGALDADAQVDTGEAERQRDSVLGALDRALARLPDEDRLILQLMFWRGHSVADVARALTLPQKPLYRRIERIFRQLRQDLAAEGVAMEQLAEFLGKLPLEPGDDPSPHDPDEPAP